MRKYNFEYISYYFLHTSNFEQIILQCIIYHYKIFQFILYSIGTQLYRDNGLKKEKDFQSETASFMSCTLFPNSCPFPSSCFIDQNISSHCGCLTVYTFQGFPGCDQWSSINYLMIIYYSLAFAFMVLFLPFALYSSKDYIFELISKKRKPTDLTFISFIAALDMVLLLVHHGIALNLWSNPLLVGDVEIDNYGQPFRTNFYRIQKLVIILLVFGIVVFDCLVISATWYLISRDIKNFQSSQFKRIRSGSFLISFSGFIIYIGLFAAGGRIAPYTFYFIGVIAGLLIIVLLVGSFSLHQEISKTLTNENSDDTRVTLNRITYAAMNAAFGVTIALAGDILVAISQHSLTMLPGYDASLPIDPAGSILASMGIIWTLTTLVYYGVINFRKKKVNISRKKSNKAIIKNATSEGIQVANPEDVKLSTES
jgi:hypothetical protein